MTTVSIGQSSDSDVLSALDACHTLGQAQIEYREYSHVATISWKIPDGGEARVDIVDHNVVSKYYVLYTVTRDTIESRGMSAQEVLERYGIPEFVERGEANDPHGCAASIVLYYPSKGFEAEIVREYNCGGDVNLVPTMSTSAYRTFRPGTIDEVLRTVEFLDDASVEQRKSKLKHGKASIACGNRFLSFA